MAILVEGIQNQSCFKRLRRLQTSQLGALALLTMEEVLMVRSLLYQLDLRQLETFSTDGQSQFGCHRPRPRY